MQSIVSSTAFLAKLCEWVGSNCQWGSAAFISPKRVSRLSCQSCFNDLHRRLLHTSVTRSCCIVRCQSRWVARNRVKQAGREVEMQADKHKTEEKNTLIHGCRASEKRIPKHAQRVDRRQPVRYADKQRSLSAVRQILLPDQQTDS